MPSFKSRLLERMLKFSNIKNAYKIEFDKGDIDNGPVSMPPAIFRLKYGIKKHTVRKRHVFDIKPKKERTNTYILFIHGGGYIHEFHLFHWMFMGSLIDELKCTVIAPDYPLAPNSNYRDAFAMLIPIYKKLIKRVGSENLILMGDSAGGGFALALAQKMRNDNIPQPAQIILISPWLDITLKNEEIKKENAGDPILDVEGLQRAGILYAGGDNPSFYMLSPINGPVDGLAPISIFIGTKDLLEADTRKFHKKMEDKAIPLNYFEYEDMLHDWVLYDLPESKQAKEEIFDLIRGK